MKSNAVIVITGASSGIGLECARVFFRAGCQVAAAARNFEALTALQKELDPAGNRLLIYKMDVTLEHECEQLIEATIQKNHETQLCFEHKKYETALKYVYLYPQIEY